MEACLFLFGGQPFAICAVWKRCSVTSVHRASTQVPLFTARHLQTWYTHATNEIVVTVSGGWWSIG
jgi:hypothetical protein